MLPISEFPFILIVFLARRWRIIWLKNNPLVWDFTSLQQKYFLVDQRSWRVFFIFQSLSSYHPLNKQWVKRVKLHNSNILWSKYTFGCPFGIPYRLWVCLTRNKAPGTPYFLALFWHVDNSWNLFWFKL